ncbi:MAG: HDOD domain-containing protein [Gammaproteobacteria bacterium]|nr:HDOD domain-containing protein [Gammaproteobacteria bacterium]
METAAAAWVRRLAGTEPPVLEESLTALRALEGTGDWLRPDAVSAAVLSDPLLTLHALQAARRHLGGRADRETTTVRHALMVLGTRTFFDRLASLPTVGQALVDHPRALSRVRELVHRARHAAAQAHDFAALRFDRDPEEAATAAVLAELPELLLCAVAPETCAELEAAGPGADPSEDERRVLGVSLQELRQPLAEALGLPEVLRGLTDSSRADQPRAFGVQLAGRIARHFQYGASAEELDEDLRQVSEWLHLPHEALVETVHRNAQVAAEMAPPRPPPAPAPVRAECVEEAARTISAHLDRTLNLHEMMMLALGGLHEGVGLGRVLFALLSPDRSHLRARLWVGVEPGSPLAGFELPVVPPHLFSRLLERPQAVWRRPGEQPELDALLTEPLAALVRGQPFFAMSLFVRDRPVGILYADQSGHEDALDAERYALFRQLGRKAAEGLAHLSGAPR